MLKQPELINSFKNYRETYEREKELDILDSFPISDNAIKRQSRIYKNIIKLDKNFDIYVHGNRNLIEQGIDDEGRKYYKIFYEEEK